MPDFWTHILGGELILEKITDKDWQKMIKQNRKIFNLGCQGPDLFYYNDFWPWIKDKRGPDIGKKFHQENIKSSLITGINYLNQQKNQNYSLLATYLTGFLTHYTLDETAHPFICARTKNFNQHKTLEINLDTYLVKKFWNKQAHRLAPIPVINIGENLPQIIRKYYQYLLTNIYNYNNEFNFINDSYQDYKQVFSIFYSPHKIKKLILKLLNYFLTFDISTLIYPDKPDYKILTNEEYLEFLDLFKQGIIEGVKLIETMINYLQGEIEKEELINIFPVTSFTGKVNNRN